MDIYVIGWMMDYELCRDDCDDDYDQGYLTEEEYEECMWDCEEL